MRLGKQVIIGGDFNETHEEEGLMHKTLTSLGLVNLFHEKMGKVPPTRKPGKRAIDYVWMTPKCFHEVRQTGLVGQDEMFLSDHVGMFLDVRACDIGKEEDIDVRVPRYLKSGNSKNVLNYLEYV